MMALTAIVLPAVFAGVILGVGKRSLAARVLPVLLGGLELAVFAGLIFLPDAPAGRFSEWIAPDGLGKVVGAVTAFLFFCAALHAFFWLPASRRFEEHEGKPMRENVFGAVLCLFLATMMLAVFARNYGLLWVAVEATTLSSALLIPFHRSAGSLEAMWKYLLICSVGIGLALFGTFLLGVAAHTGGGSPYLSFASLAAVRNGMSPAWIKAAFLFCFAGYGLKMGLAPFHTWLPDAHSEAPSTVSVLLSGALLNCSFLGIVRVMGAVAPPLLGFCREYLVGFGLFSLLTAAFFLIRQSDYKRLLAYSSVEHMGLLAIFWGLELSNIALIHLAMHSVCKMLLFLTAGNILLAYGTRRIDRVRGLFGVMPRTAALWLAGILLICGMPPSPLFVTELELVRRAGPVLGAVILALLFAVFCGMTSSALRMTTGGASRGLSAEAEAAGEELSLLPAVLMQIPLLTGVVLILKLTGVIG